VFWFSSSAKSHKRRSRSQRRAAAPFYDNNEQYASANETEASLSPSSASIEARWSDLHVWLNDADERHKGLGRAFGVPLAVEDCAMGDATVRGVTAQADAAANTSLLSVPFAATIDEAGARAAYGPGGDSVPWPVAFAHFLLVDRARGRQSEWAPYVDTLHPQLEYVGSVLADAEGVATLLDDGLAYAARAVRELDELVYDAARRDTRFDADAWRWAIASVLSRTLRTRAGGARLMIPAVDMLNHGGAAKNIALAKERREGEGNDIIHVVATSSIAKGDQLLFTYGDTRANDDFFLYYGFLLPNASHDIARLWDDVHACAAWAERYFGASAVSAEAASCARGATPQVGDAVPRVPLLPLDAPPDMEVDRIQAPFRLHFDEAIGDAADVVPLADELLVRADACVDTRASAILSTAAGGNAHAVSGAIAARCDELLASLGDVHGRPGTSHLSELATSFRREKARVLSRVRDTLRGM